MDAKSKSNVISDKIRQDGNKQFVKSDYFDALSKYNEAIRYAELGSKQLGLCYGNRSAAFLKVKQYKACLENIEMARKNQFPAELLQKLSDRETDCMKLMEECPTEKPWNDFFKMTYEPNPKFPYLADCLQLKEHSNGWFLTANRDLNAGDIVGISKPFVQFPLDTSSYRCNYCLADKFMNFIPCSGCAEVMFCNDVCMQKAKNEFHKFECGIDNPEVALIHMYALRMIVKCYSLFDGDRTKIENFFMSNQKYVSSSVLTPFDFDLSDPSSLASEKNLMLTQLCMTQQYDKKDYQYDFYMIQSFLKRHPKLRAFVTQKMFALAVNYAMGDAKRYKGVGGLKLSKHNQDMGRCVINYFGDAIDLCFNIIRHSCAPNMILHSYNGMMVWMINYPVKANEWLTVAFNNTVFFERSIPERVTGDVFGIIPKCKCAACTGKWDRVIAACVAPIYIMRYTSDEAIENYATYSSEINKKAKPLGKECDELVWFEVSRFRWNIMNIGKASFWDKIAPMSGLADGLEHLVKLHN